MTRILLLAATTGYQTRSFLQAARRLNLDVTLATDRCHILDDPWGDRAIPVRFEDPAESAESIVNALNGNRIDGIVAVGDRPTTIAAMAAERIGLPWHPTGAAEACRDKTRMRKLFAAAGLRTPEFRRVSVDRAPRELLNAVRFPAVLKPIGLSGSRGVIRVNNPAEFVASFARVRAIVEASGPANHSGIQIETYIPGREFALEGLMTSGVLRILALFDKPDPLDGPFFEETIYVTPCHEPAEVQEAIAETTTRACRALGLRHGPVHAEMRVNDSGVYMLEIAARPIGGLCARALRFHGPGSGGEITLEELILLHATARMPEELQFASAASGVMMIPVPRAGIFQSVEGIEQARRVPGISEIEITVKRGEKLIPLPEGASYTGFIFANGDDPASVESALRRAHEALRFVTLGALDVVP